MSSKSMAQKLFIKEGKRVFFINPPENYMKIIGELPNNVEILENPVGKMDIIKLFVKNKKELEEL